MIGSAVLGVVLLFAWISGIVYVYNKGQLFVLPGDALLLRNIMYFKPAAPSKPSRE